MPDTGCNTQSLVDSSFVRRNKLERIPIVPREIKAYDDRPGEKVQAVVRYEIDIGAHKSMVWAYEVERMKDQEIILGLPWLQKNSVANLRSSQKGHSCSFKGRNIEFRPFMLRLLI